MTDRYHLMVDLETLTGPRDATIAGVALVRFWPGQDREPQVVMDTAIELRGRLGVDAETLSFWFSQDPAVRQQVFRGLSPSGTCSHPGGWPLRIVLEILMEELPRAEAIWSKPSLFDGQILIDKLEERARFHEAGQKQLADKFRSARDLLSHRARCVRTACMVLGREPTRATTPHDPVQDCLAQIKDVVEFLALRPP